MKKLFYLLIPIFTIFAFSCGDAVENAVNSATTAASGGNLLNNADKLKKAQEDLMNLEGFKGKDLQVFQKVLFYGDGRIVVELEDPNKAGNIDHYEWHGKWSEPQPVQITGDGDMKANLTPLKDIKFETVAKIYDTWMEKAKTVEGAEDKELDFVFFSLWVPNQTRSWKTSNIEGSREEYQIDFNMDGSIKTYEKN